MLFSVNIATIINIINTHLEELPNFRILKQNKMDLNKIRILYVKTRHEPGKYQFKLGIMYFTLEKSV